MAATVGGQGFRTSKASFSWPASSPRPVADGSELLDIGAGAERSIARPGDDERTNSLVPFELLESFDQLPCHTSVTRLSGGLLRVSFDASCESLHEDEPALSGARQGQTTPATTARGLGIGRATK